MTSVVNTPQVKAVINELESANIPYQVDNGSKHTIIRFELNGKKHSTTVSRGTRFAPRNLLNSRADTRRKIRREMAASPDALSPPGESIMSSLVLTESSLELVRGQPRMRDTDIAQALGFTRPDNIRNLIKSNLEEMENFGEVCFAEKQTTERGGRPSQAYLLNRDQTILAAILSRAPGSREVRQQVIQAYNEWNMNHTAETTQPPAISASADMKAEPEIMLNEPAIQAITNAVVDRMSAAIPGSNAVSVEDLREILTQFFNWQKGQFDQLTQKLESPALPAPSSQSMDTLIGQLSDRIDENTRSISRTIREQLQETIASLSLSGAAPTVAAASEPEAEPKPEAYVNLKDIYAMLGIKANNLSERGRLSSKVRFSMERMSRKQKVKPRLIRKYGVNQLEWPMAFATEWYQKEGRQIINSHLNGKIPETLA